MIILNHEYYVSFDVAKLLKEAGFDWECKLHFSELNAPKEAGIFDISTNKVYGVFDNPTEDDILRPTIDVAQRWLREVNDVDIMVRVYYHYGEYYSKSYCGTFYIGDELYTTEQFNTYGEAQEAGIKKALELILEKGE